jgi:DNA repair exonuclease SbcCD ATPase subunit
MKITRLKLVNFIGIMHGTGLNEIEIDFTKCKNTIIMLLGGNGSGKSTILSQLQPYKDSFDERKTLILDGLEGRKEIDYDYNGHTYQIVHIYSGTAQSFFKKDGVELNENGSVRNCEDLITKELGLTKDYFKIGKIGSNTQNFVDYTTADRKNYIGTFLNIEDIIEKYNIAKKKLTDLKRDIDIAGNELSKYQSKDVLDTQITQVSTDIKTAETTLETYLPKQGALKAEISRDQADIDKELPLDTIKTNKVNTKIDLENAEKITKDLETKLENLDKLDEIETKLTEDISKIQAELAVNNSEKTNKNLLILNSKNKISELETEMSALGNPEDIVKVEETLETLNKQQEDLRTEIKNNPTSELINNMLKNKIDVSKMLNKFIDFADFIEKYFTNLQAHSVINTESNISLFLKEDFDTSIIRQINDSRLTIKSKQDLLSNKEKEKTQDEGYVCQLENLNKRPVECHIDSCPFIKDALEHKNILVDINKKDQEIINIKHDIDVLNTKAESIQELQNMYSLFSEAYKNVSFRENLILTEFLKTKSLQEWIQGSLSDFSVQRQNLVTNVNSAINDINTFLTNSQKIRNLEQSRKSMKDSDNTVRTKYQKDIDSEKKNYETLNNDYSILEKQGTEISTKLLNKQNLKQLYETYKQNKDKLGSDKLTLEDLETKETNINKLLADRTSKETELKDISEKISAATITKATKQKELNDLNSSLSQLKLINDRLDKLKKDYEPTSIIAATLSPNSGIPLIYIKEYLSETETIANDLLNIAYNGNFEIKFVTTEKEFKIEVRAKNNIKQDIKLASQGEVALTTISISLALIEQQISGYNILCLDEIDGSLDEDNRKNFIDILNSQINKLGIEQVFVISHNNAFDICPMDLILLNGNHVDKASSFIDNKNIIYELGK